MRTFPHVPIFQKAYSYRICFFLRKLKCTKFPVSGRFRRRVCAYVCECVCVKESVCDLCWHVCACAS